MAQSVQPYGAPGSVDAAMDEAERLKLVQERFRRASERDRRDDELAHEDLLMRAGGKNQWDERAVAERERLGRPLYTANRFPAMLAQITGEVMANPPAITCAPADAEATPETAQVFEGLIRSIERLSQAQQAYAGSLEAAAACGKGHLRVVPIYADDESFDVELRIRQIHNVYSVKWDPSAKEFDKSDANWCIVTTTLDKKAFGEAYPDLGQSGWDSALAYQRKVDGWRSGEGDTVTVAEEWVVKKEPFKRYRIAHTRMGYRGMEMLPPTGEEEILDGDPGQDTIDGEDAEMFLAQLQAEGWDVVQTRTAYKRKVCMYLWGGTKQLAGPIEWKGSRIPVWTVPGRVVHIGDEVIHEGVIRHGKDAQRLHNWSRATDLEAVSSQTKAPIIVAEGQIDGFEDEWMLSQKQQLPFLRYQHIDGVPAPQERSGIPTNPGPNNLAQAAIADLEDSTGIHAASLGKKSNETSGKAIEARDSQTDTGTFSFIYNLRLIVESIGRELVAAIPHYYSTRKQIMILGQDDAPAVVSLEGVNFDLGKYHVICKSGPAYQTKREKAADMYVEMSRAAPPWAQPIIFKRVVKLTEPPDADEFIAELQAVGEMVGALPPSNPMGGAMPGMMPGAPQPGAPGGPPASPPGAPLPANVIPMPPRPPAGSDPLAAGPANPFPPPRVPAARPVVGPQRPPGI